MIRILKQTINSLPNHHPSERPAKRSSRNQNLVKEYRHGFREDPRLPQTFMQPVKLLSKPVSYDSPIIAAGATESDPPLVELIASDFSQLAPFVLALKICWILWTNMSAIFSTFPRLRLSKIAVKTATSLWSRISVMPLYRSAIKIGKYLRWLAQTTAPMGFGASSGWV